MAVVGTRHPLLESAEIEQLQREVSAYVHRNTRRAVATPYHGPSPSPHRGHGMDLHDMRPYHPGDDIRHMDWRATARSGRPTTKVFLEERQRSVLLVVDRRGPMMFGTRGELKAASAARCAAILAFAALAVHEAVAGMILNRRPQWFAPSRTLDGVAPLLRAASAPPVEPVRDTTDDVTLSTVWPELERHVARGATIYLISDFHEEMQPREDNRAPIPHSPRHETVAVRIVDPVERDLPAAGRLRLVAPNGGDTVVIDSDDPALRERYSEHMNRREERLRMMCNRSGIPLVHVETQRSALRQLAELL
jgi:uncharacterized protein (DUF58 family)